MFEPGAFAAGAFSVPPKGPSGTRPVVSMWYTARFQVVYRARGGMRYMPRKALAA